MSDLLSIRVRKASFLEDLKDLRDEAKTQAPVEIAATTNIQRVYRGKVDRAYIAFKSK